MLLGLLNDPLALVAFALALGIGITVHECSHAFVANLLGDPTAKYEGRLTLNPLAHLDLLGTAMLLLAGFGWGKPVPVNPGYFARPVLDELLSSLAGPASNFLVAALIGGLLQLTGATGTVATLGVVILQINLLLMLFNLLPVPPLDGSKVLHIFLDTTTYRMLQVYSLPLIVFLLIALQTTGLGAWLGSLVTTLTRFLLGL
jgi:Zn-dependent protease